MISLFVWVFYGLIVGLISKAIYRHKETPVGFASTLAIGVCGSFVGGFISYLAGTGNAMQPSGIVMGVLGGVITCFLHRKFVTERGEQT